jgi:hypothetical protein
LTDELRSVTKGLGTNIFMGAAIGGVCAAAQKIGQDMDQKKINNTTTNKLDVQAIRDKQGLPPQA